MFRAMQQFNFNVVDSQDAERDVPDHVAEAVMGDIQALITDVGELLVRRELRTQNLLPSWMESRFSLRPIEGASEGRRDGTLLESALLSVLDEFDAARRPMKVPDEAANHIEAEGRRRIARDMLSLSDHLDGYTLMYGTDGNSVRLRINNKAALEIEASDRYLPPLSAVIGIIRKDPVRKSRYQFSNGIDTVPISFEDSFPYQVDSITVAGPVIVTGTIVTDADGNLKEVRSAENCYDFPMVRFHRIITDRRDILLFNPVMAAPTYSDSTRMWSLANEDLGIDVSRASWDEVVVAFHDYFMFLWETYAESDDDFVGEEKEVRDFLLSMSFP